MTSRATIPVLILAAVLAAAAAPQPVQRGKLTIHEIPVGSFGSADALQSLSMTSDSSHIAILTRKPGPAGMFVVTRDGVPGKEYEWIIRASLNFNRDGSRLAYIVQQGEGMFVVVDEKPGKVYHEIVGSTVLWAPVGERLLYVARKTAGGKLVVVVDGRESREYEQVVHVSFSPDGKRLALIVQEEGQQWIVLDGTDQPKYEAVVPAGLAWSPDGSRLAYVAVAARGTEKKVVVVVDGKEMVECEEASPPVFSPDSKRVAFSVVNAGRMRIHVDGQPGPEYDSVAATPIIFSPDSRRLAYAARRIDPADSRKSRYFYVLDGQEQPAYDQLVRGGALFSPDSREFSFAALRGNRIVFVIRGIEGRDYEDVKMAQYSPDGSRLAYLGLRDGRAYVVVNNRESGPYHTVSSLMFSPDGSRMAYVAQRERTVSVIVNDVPQKEYTGIVPTTLAFSPDGRHLAYQAQRDDTPVIVVNDQEAVEGAPTLRGSRLVFENNNTLRGFIARDLNVLKLRIEIGE